jgi:hypothetical protein
MSTTPGGPDYLDTTGPDRSAPSDDNRKRLVVLGGLVAGAAVVAGGAWAATSFFATGAQPAQALPDTTVAYFSVDLDPSGGQKIEAIQTLRKFPAFREEIGLEADDDLRERLFEEITDSGECEGLDYAADVKPWLGSRAAMAVVDLGEDAPSPVGVIQVTDAGKAEDGVATLVETCGGSEESGDVGGWVVDGDWMVVAETEEIAQQVVDAAGEATLADDADFGRWTGEAGDDGFMTVYVATGVTKYVDELGGLGMPGAPALGGDTDATEMCESYGAEGSPEREECLEIFGGGTDAAPEEVPDELQQVIDDFEGMAATVRFDDGSVEVEYAMSNYQEDLTKFVASDAGVGMVAGLPDDTVAALGFSLTEGWGEAVLDYAKQMLSSDDGSDIDEEIAQFEEETGLSVPEDLETLLGEGVTISLGSGIDPDAIANGGPGEVPFGVRIKGDAGEIQAVLDKLKDLAGPEFGDYFEVTEADGYAVFALQDDYRSALESGGDLGGSDDYAKVVEDGEAQSVLFVNFDADDNWLVRVTEEMPEVSENLEPLSAFGVSGWVDGDVVHGQVKLTTD